jgi:hypothetical protein
MGDLVKDGVSEDEMKKIKQEMLSEVSQFKHFLPSTLVAVLGLSKTDLHASNTRVFIW